MPLPANYSCLSQNMMTSVKDQGSCASCWVFAWVGIVESWIKTNMNQTVDLAEEAIKECEVGRMENTCGGGTYDASEAYSTSRGIPLETANYMTYVDDPNPETCYPTAAYYVDGWEFVSSNNGTGFNAELVKQAIFDYGPMYTQMNASFDGFWNLDDNTCQVHTPGDSNTDHAVIVCGWDDDKSCSGEANGAFLLKNSYNASWGDSGYWWQSYTGRSHVGTTLFRITAVSPRSKKDQRYFYDEGGWGNDYGFSSNVGYGLCKFTAANNLTVRAVQTYATALAGVTANIAIYDDFDGNNTGTLLGSENGANISATGFFTIPLTTPINFNASDTIAVRVHFVAKSSYESPIPIDEMDTAYANIETGKCFVSANGNNGSWTDASTLGTPADVCIRLVTTLGHTQVAANLTYDGVFAAYNNCSNGDTVLLPAGSENWNGMLWNDPDADTLIIEKTDLTIQGQGPANTQIGFATREREQPIFSANAINGLVVRDLKLRGTRDLYEPGGSGHELLMAFRDSNVEVYNCICQESSLSSIDASGYPIEALIHHCNFTDGGVAGTGYGVTSDGATVAEIDANWNAGNNSVNGAENWGSKDGLVIEDSNFDSFRHFIAGGSGSRYTVRNSRFLNDYGLAEHMLDIHGPNDYGRGGLKVEAYDNYFDMIDDEEKYLLNIGTGKWIFTDNVIVNFNDTANQLHFHRLNCCALGAAGYYHNATETITNDGWTISGGGNAETVLGDANNSTYVQCATGGGNLVVEYDMNNATDVPSWFHEIHVLFWAQASNAGQSINVDIFNNATGVANAFVAQNISTSLTEYEYVMANAEKPTFQANWADFRIRFQEENVASGEWVRIVGAQIMASCGPKADYQDRPEEVYMWDNVLNGNNYETEEGAGLTLSYACFDDEDAPFMALNEEYFFSARPGWTKLTYPYPGAIGHGDVTEYDEGAFSITAGAGSFLLTGVAANLTYSGPPAQTKTRLRWTTIRS